MREFNSFGEFARHLAGVARAMPQAKKVMLASVGLNVSQQAKTELGFYQDAVGPFVKWAPLADATKERRAHLGYTPDDPLLMSGALQQSISYKVHERAVDIGSPQPYAVFLEYGTSKMPPRPFLGPAQIHTREANVHSMTYRVALTFRATR